MALMTLVPYGELASLARWDAEAFTPFLRETYQQLADCPLLTELATVTHAGEILRVYSSDDCGVPFLLAQNIRPLLPDFNHVATIPKPTANTIPQNKLMNGDALVTRTGANSGVACVYLGVDGSAYTSGEGIILRSRGDIDGAYLAAYLNSRVGLALCKQAIYGSGQPHVGPKYLEKIPVFRAGAYELKVAHFVKTAYALL
jgi:hypothetical protein